jgi:hypothetical protein
VVRFDSSGILDTSFGIGWKARTQIPSERWAGTALAQEADGKILVSSWGLNRPELYTVRFTAGGILDPTFGVGGIATDDELYYAPGNIAMVISPEGGPIVLCGDGLMYQGLLIHLESSTSASPVFDEPIHSDAMSIRSINPNPFSSTTTVMFDLPGGSGFNAEVFDIRGQRIRSLARAEVAAGPRTLSWDGRDEAGLKVADGVYFFRLETGGMSLTKKMVLIK